jgi:pyruvate dehydrogenase E2 component (dihydrolipoamide acetyltransferase)
MAEVTMPRLSDTMAEGTVGRWLKQPGDQVHAGEVIAEIETDKAVMELEAFESGTLQTILVPEGQTVPIGQPIALIGAGAVEAADVIAPASGAQQTRSEEGAPESFVGPTSETHAQVQPVVAPPPPVVQGDAQNAMGRVKASPLARRMAEAYGVDLHQVRGTGPGGRIIKENVEDVRQGAAQTAAAPAAPSAVPVAPAPPAAPPAVPLAPAAGAVPMSRMRRAITRTMTESKPGVPHVYVASEIDMAAALKLRQEINAGDAADVKISVNAIVVKAAAKALRTFPSLNSSYALTADGQPGIVQHDEINIGVAISLDEGVIAPVVQHADKQDLSTIAAQIKDLAGRARAGTIKQTELEGATFQVSNLGMLDVLAFVSVITPPQAASLAVGAIRRVPVFREDGQVGAAEQMWVVLSVDHRVVDGATAARYLQELKRLLQSPMRIVV